MEVVLSLKLRIGLDGLTESPLINDPAALESFIRTTVDGAMAAVVSPGDGASTVVTAAKTKEITILTGGAPAGEKAKVLLRQIGSMAMDEVPDLSGVLCIPVWVAPSDKLPDMLLFVRPSGVPGREEQDSMVIRMQAGQAMATILRKQADVYENMLQSQHAQMHFLTHEITQRQNQLTALSAAVADAGTQPPAPNLATPNAP